MERNENMMAFRARVCLVAGLTAEHFLPAEYATFAPMCKYAVVNEITQGKRTFSHIRDLLLRGLSALTDPVSP